MNYKRIEFLHLEISSKQRNIISRDDYKFICSFPSTYRHLLHTTNPDLEICNTIIDMLISLGGSLAHSIDTNNRILQDLLEHNKSRISEMKDIKNFLHTSLHTPTGIKKDFSKAEMTNLFQGLDLYKPKPIELEIREVLNHTKEGIGKVEDLAKKQLVFLEGLKTFLSN